MKVFVTGADGFLGSSLVRQLLSAGHQVKALVHRPKKLDTLAGLAVEKITGDILNLPAMLQAIEGVEAVFHLASRYEFYPWWQKEAPEIYKVNVLGTKNILTAAAQSKIKRFIFTSSVAALGKSKGQGPTNEDTTFNSGAKFSHYARSKRLAEEEVLAFAKQGLPAVILNPAALIGERDAKPTPTGRMILDFLNRRFPGYFKAAISLADVDDVARAHLAALEKGRIGERYILCNNRAYSLAELFYLMEQVSGVKAPRRKIPYLFLISFLYLDELISYFLKKKPLLSTKAVKFCRSGIIFDNTKAAKELGYTTTPITTSLEKAVRWYKENGYVR